MRGVADESTVEGLSLGYMENDIIYTTPNLPTVQPTTRTVPIGLVKQEPSKRATLSVLRMFSWEACGDRIEMSPEVREHKWIIDELVI